MSELAKVLDEIDKMMGSVQQEADAARERGAQVLADAESSALDGKILVRVGADGRVRELLLADEVMSMRAADLARELTAAINAAWGKSRSSDQAASAAAAVDMAALAARVGALREESAQSMGRITTALTDALAKIDRRLP